MYYIDSFEKKNTPSQVHPLDFLLDEHSPRATLATKKCPHDVKNDNSSIIWSAYE